MAERRDLTFANLDDVMPEVGRLLAGHTTVGRWTLGQICNHVAAALRLTLEAPPTPAEPTREQRVARRLFFRSGRFPEGMEAPIPVLQPQLGLDAATEAEALRVAIGRFASASGPFPAHPVLGPLTKEEWIRFHCLHCAHHLGFAVPDEARTPSS
jgi:Protein of unknown function (DUF1569)